MNISVFQQIKNAHPLVHAITNSVTKNDVVNIILASGATAICADAPEESAEITRLSDGLLLNTGTPDSSRFDAMLRAGKAANEKGIPVVLDPVGAGASTFRRAFLHDLLGQVHFTCIRGNMSEMAALDGMTFSSKGVEDAGASVKPEELMKLSGHLHAVLAVTGETDFAVTPKTVRRSQTGTPLEKRITGAGCMLSGLVTAALSACLKEGGMEEAAGIAHDVMRRYGELAQEAERVMRERNLAGTASFRSLLIDAVSRDAGTV